MKIWICKFLVPCLTITIAGSHAMADETVATALAKTKLGGLIQFWGLNDTTAANNANSNFRVRRAELKLNGSVIENTRWFLMIDASKNMTISDTDANGNANESKLDKKVLQDVGVAYSPFENFEIVAGQFKIPTFSEGFQSSSELVFIERSYITRTYGDRRDQGLMVDYTFNPVRIRAMLSNGQVATGRLTANVNDSNSSKDLTARVDVTIMEGLKLGVFDNSAVSNQGHSNRIGGDIEFTMNPIWARISGVFADDIALGTNDRFARSLDRNGMSIEAGYTLMTTCQFVGRYETFQTTTDGFKASSDAYTVGFNHFVKGHNLKVQLDQSFFNNMAGTDGTSSVDKTKNGSLTVLSFQVAM